MSATDRDWLLQTIRLSRRCAPVSTAYNVGAVLVRGGTVITEGHSRETDTAVHAEEAALAKAAGQLLTGATLYTSLEPCTTRASRPADCTRLILDAGIARVVFAMREPPRFARCEGVATLRAAGVEVVEIGELAPEVLRVNAHLLG
ncbi:deaminase [Krasilnikovia sp. MM14-A1004]|uniref:deaminase n=1 Tax=Krasilnikovia sp. MM14-A1004 TaxID=3373541 RepID=UPI00399CE2D3